MSQPNPILEIVQRAANNAAQSAASVAAREQAAAVEGQRIIGEAIATNKTIAANQQIVTGAQRAGELAAQTQMLDIISGAKGFETLGNLLKKSTATATEVVAQTDVVRKEQETRLIDDPFTWIKAQFDWDNNQKKLEGAVGQLQVVSQAAQQVAGQISQVGIQSKATAKVITQAGIQAELDNIALTAQQQQHQLALENLKYNVMGVKAAAEADDKLLNLATQVGTFERMEAQFQQGLVEEQRRREQFDWQREQQKAVAEEKLDAKQFEARTIAYINAGEAARGLTPSSSQQIRDMIKLNKGLSAEYAELYRNGEIAARTGQAIISISPGKVSGILAADPTLIGQLDENQKKVAEVLIEARKVLGDKALRQREGLDDDKTGAKAERVVSAQVTQLLTRQLNFVGNNPDNVFFIGDPASYIGKPGAPGISTFQNYPLVQKVFNPAIAANVSLTDISVPWKLSVEAVRKGEISTAQAAADFSNIYRRMSAVHRAGADFRKFAISLPPEGSQYKVKIDGEVVDVTDYQAVATAMAQQLRREALNKSPTPAGFIGRAMEGYRK
jgi:hypothetical protein